MPKNTPRQRRKARNLNRILETAARLIVEQGIENVSLREIAREADYSPAALYKYFDGKAALYLQLLTAENKKLLEQLAALPEELPADQRLVESCLIYIRYNLDHPAYPILVNTLPGGRKTFEDAVPADSPYIVFRELVRQWAADAGLALGTPTILDEITYAFWATTHGLASLQLGPLKGFEADFPAVDRRTIETYLKGLLQ
jgi:AcrR family transcriptional regulator